MLSAVFVVGTLSPSQAGFSLTRLFLPFVGDLHAARLYDDLTFR
jgi:hypothetical protein